MPKPVSGASRAAIVYVRLVHRAVGKDSWTVVPGMNGQVQGSVNSSVSLWMAPSEAVTAFVVRTSSSV